MNVRKIMTAPVITIGPIASVFDLANLMVENHISGIPVVGESGKLVGIVTEGDLLRRYELSTEKRYPWWSQILCRESVLTDEYVRARAKTISDIMSADPVTISPNESVGRMVELLEKHAIKRLPVVENGELVGIASRADLIRAFAALNRLEHIEIDDRHIRERLLCHLAAQPWAHIKLVNVNVDGGVVELTGVVRTDAERKAIRVAAESMSGVKQVIDRMVQQPITADL